MLGTTTCPSIRRPAFGRVAACLALVLAAGLLLALPELAHAHAQAQAAQPAEPLRPPRPEEPADPPVIRNFLVAGIVLVSIIAATVIPAKRGHQD